MVVRKSSKSTTSSTSSSSTTSRTSSIRPPPSAVTDDWDADDEGAMSANDSPPPPRPLTVAIPTAAGVSGPFCPRRPNLREILANTSPAPWSLAAFMAYLSNNHCLETLEFTMDAGRYRKHYQKMESRATNGGMPPAKDREYVQALWQKLVDAYIKPNGSREVNLPSDVRDPILRLKPQTMPPAPDKLDRAVAKIYELMEDSVLVPFLNSVYPQSATTAVSSCPGGTVDDFDLDNRPTYSRSVRQVRRSPPYAAAVPANPRTHAGAHRQSAPPSSTSVSNSNNKARFSVKLSPTTSAPMRSMHSLAHSESSAAAFYDGNFSASGSGSGPGMTDDSASADSPTNEGPMTPPTSPPLSELSPKRDSGMWRKLGSLSRMKVGKKKSQGALKEEL